MSHRQYFTVLAGLLSLRTAVERGRCWKYKKTVVRARARRGRVRAAELAEQLAAGCRMIAARQLDLLLEQLFGAPCVASCAREAVESRATTFAKPRGFHQGARRSGDTSAALNDGSRPCTAPWRRARRGASAPFQPARVGPAAASRLQRWPTGAVGPHRPALGPRGRHSAPKGAENATGERQAGHCPRPRRAPYLNSSVYLRTLIGNTLIL